MGRRNHLVCIAVAVSPAAAAEKVLRWAWDVSAQSYDPHAFDGPSAGQQDQIFERLLNTSADLQVVPQLAVAWRLVDPVTWQFDLRQGVRFHDGSPFTAEDVVFSIERARADPSFLAEDFAHITDIRMVDAHTVRIATRAPDVLLPDRLRKLFIMSKAWAEAHGVTRAADFRVGPQEAIYTTRHANGTGPFMLETFEPDGRIVTRRNPDWWGYEDYPVNIDRIEFSVIADPEQRVQALLKGEIDLILSPPLDALPRIEGTPGLKLVQTTQLRSVWLGVDQARAELRSSDVKGKNPFKDKRVRQAMYQAIDIEAIREEVMHGWSVPAAMIVPSGVNGHSLELDERLAHDPAAAKALLAEAGYPNGFAVTLDCPSNYYINDEAICRAVARQLKEIGIAVAVNAQTADRHWEKYDARETDFWFSSFTAQTLDSLEVLVYEFQTGGSYNAYGYSNPRIDELIKEIETASVTYVRDALIEEAWQIILDDIVFLPLHHQVLVWAMRENLDLPINPMNYVYFREARLN